MEDNISKSNTKTSSKELLSVNGDGSSRAVLESLLGKHQSPASEKPQTFKIARSPLFEQLQSFLPKLERSNQQLLAMPPEKLDTLSIENTDDNDKVVEMNIVVGEMDGVQEAESDATDSDTSDDDTPNIGHVTEHNLKIPSGATGGRKSAKPLIEEMTDASEESGRSDAESTGESSGSGER